MIVVFDFQLTGTSSIPDFEEGFMSATRRALSESSLRGLLIWPTPSGERVRLMAEGEEDPRALANGIVLQVTRQEIDCGIARIAVETWGDPPAELDALPSDERTLELVRMAFPEPGETCGRCDAILPPHLSSCPWAGLGGHGDPPSGRERSKGGGGEDVRREQSDYETLAPPERFVISVEEPEEVVSAKST